MKNRSPLPFRVVRDGAGIVSTHRTESGARRSLARQVSGSASQGGFCLDYIEHLVDGRFVRLEGQE